MKSSSSLFPVSLVQAELRSSTTEDTYLIKHNRDKDHSVEVALTRLGKVDQEHSGQPVIMLHGSFSNRSFWTSGDNPRLGNYLLEHGYDVWIMEHRGHGLSPHNKQYRTNTMSDYVQFDMPAIQEFVEEQTSRDVIWIGHSLGGQMIASAVAAGTLATLPRAIVLAGTRVYGRPKYLWLPGVGAVMRRIIKRRGSLDGRKLGIGPEEEPAGVIREYLSRLDWLGRWELDPYQEEGLMPGWTTASIPMLGLSATNDTTDAPHHCHRFYQQYGGPLTDLELGKKTGFKTDFDHVSMLIGADARDEVYPRILDWLDHNCR